MDSQPLTGIVYAFHPPETLVIIASDGEEVILPYSERETHKLWMNAEVILSKEQDGYVIAAAETATHLQAQLALEEVLAASEHDAEVQDRLPLHIGYYLSDYQARHPEMSGEAIAALLDISPELVAEMLRGEGLPDIELMARMYEQQMLPPTIDIGQTPGSFDPHGGGGALYILDRGAAKEFLKRLDS